MYERHHHFVRFGEGWLAKLSKEIIKAHSKRERPFGKEEERARKLMYNYLKEEETELWLLNKANRSTLLNSSDGGKWGC